MVGCTEASVCDIRSPNTENDEAFCTLCQAAAVRSSSPRFAPRVCFLTSFEFLPRLKKGKNEFLLRQSFNKIERYIFAALLITYVVTRSLGRHFT